MGSDHEGFHTPHGGINPEHANYDEQKQQQLAAFLSVLAQQTPLNQSTKQTTSTSVGPSNKNLNYLFENFVINSFNSGPALRSRLVWDPAHIVYLENWYGKETRYPNLVQCQAYANQLSRVPQSGKFIRSTRDEMSN